MKIRLASCLIVCAYAFPGVAAWSPSSTGRGAEAFPPTTSRRGFGQAVLRQIATTGALVSTAAISLPQAALAKADESVMLKADHTKLRQGYDRLNYLLDHWVELTTVCGKGDDNPYTGDRGCERSPLIVMEYLGYRSTQDPLFKADKTMMRLANGVATADAPAYLDAMEKYAEAAEEASGMAYVSSWGEANPGGGKDRVEFFIERAKKNVIDSRDSLATALRILDVSS